MEVCMTIAELTQKINELTQKITEYPQGSIVRKTINGKVRYYLQWRVNGKTRSSYIKEADLDNIHARIAERQKLEEQRKDLQKEIKDLSSSSPSTMDFYTNVVTGEQLDIATGQVKDFKTRRGFQMIRRYLEMEIYGRVFILYGLRRTGKTTMLFQAIRSLPLEKTAYIKMRPSDDMRMLCKDLDVLFKMGVRYVFIDEITLMNDFINTAACLSDIYCQMGMKIVISGTDSLGFIFADANELYDRNVMLRTSFIPFREYVNLLDIRSIDRYIEYGGTLRMENMDFDDPDSASDDVSFRDDDSTRKYIDTAISRNIQHSLENDRFASRFGVLQELYDKGELTNVINRIVEDMNHRFVLNVVVNQFKSHDLGSAKSLLLKNPDSNIKDALYNINTEEVVATLKKLIDIKEKEEQTIPITEAHIAQIKRYLFMLDLIVDYPTFYDSYAKVERIVFTQPGMRYSIAKALVYALMQDAYFLSLSKEDRDFISEKILEDVKGRMLEDIITLEFNKTQRKAFKVCFVDGGEFDMVVTYEDGVEIYEIKHSDKAIPEQAHHLFDETKCAFVEHTFGKIKGKYVLYRGKSMELQGIQYRNIEEVLCSL